MKTIGSRSVSFLALLILGCALVACGNTVELKPKVQAYLDEYERLIETYETQFAAANGNPPQFADVADSYSKEIQLWMSKWDTVAPSLSEAEGKALKASIEKLNRRAERMLRGS